MERLEFQLNPDPDEDPDPEVGKANRDRFRA